MAIEKVVNIVVKNNINTAVTDVKALEVELKKAGTGAKDFNKEIDKSGGKTGVFDQLKKGAQDLIPGLKGAESGMSSMIIKMWEMCANPLGLVIAGIVGGLKFLYEAFQSSVAGGKEIKAIWAGLNGVFEQGKDAIFGLGRALINVATAAYQFISLDFKGAAESMKKANGEATESYKQLGNAVDGTTFKIIRNLEKQQQANDKAKKVQAVVQSETNKLLVQSREILTDETASIKEKKKALEEVTKAEKASSAEKVRIAKEDKKILEERAAALGGEAEKKMKGQIRDATIALNEAETENAMTGIKLNKQRKMLSRQESSDAKEAADAEKARIKSITDANKVASDIKIAQAKADALVLKAFQDDVLKNQQKMNVDNYNKEIQDILDKKTNQDLRLQNISDEVDALDAFNQKEVDNAKIKKDKLAQDEIDAQKRKYEALSSITQNGMNFISALQDAGIAKGKAGQMAMKALTLAQIGVDTAAAFSNAVPMALNAGKEAAKLAGPAAPFVGPIATAASYLSSATMIVSNIAKAKRILSSGGGAEGGSAGGGAPSAPPQFNIVGQNSNNQLAQSIGKSQSRPVEAFVVSGNMTTAQSLDRNRIQTATFN